jgi:thiamine biosynthesis lipoprotein
MRKIVAVMLLLGVGCLLALRNQEDSARPASPHAVVFSGMTMGTSYTIRVVSEPLAGPAEVAHGPQAVGDRLQQQVETRLDTINAQMSTYLKSSELSRFNQSSSIDWFEVSADTAQVVAAGLDIARRSGGAFDITVGPLVNLWSFGPDRRPQGIPSDREIVAAQARVGYDHVQVRLSPPALRKRLPDVYVDLSAIAKGFAVDKIAELLENQGIERFMVEIGGEVRTKGKRPDGGPWRIGVERPVPGARALFCVVTLEDRSLATSGDYRNFFESDGRIYSHEIDPRTGRPVRGGAASVTVLADSSMVADAWATAMMVLEPQKAIELAGKEELDVLLIVRNEHGLSEQRTPGFSAAFSRDPTRGEQ